jgi:hypothetical protein
MLEQNDLGAQILAAVNAKLIDRGLMLKTGTVVMFALSNLWMVRKRMTQGLAA